MYIYILYISCIYVYILSMSYLSFISCIDRICISRYRIDMSYISPVHILYIRIHHIYILCFCIYDIYMIGPETWLKWAGEEDPYVSLIDKGGQDYEAPAGPAAARAFVGQGVCFCVCQWVARGLEFPLRSPKLMCPSALLSLSRSFSLFLTLSRRSFAGRVLGSSLSSCSWRHSAGTHWDYHCWRVRPHHYHPGVHALLHVCLFVCVYLFVWIHISETAA
jgi:hypothetical protein